MTKLRPSQVWTPGWLCDKLYSVLANGEGDPDGAVVAEVGGTNIASLWVVELASGQDPALADTSSGG